MFRMLRRLFDCDAWRPAREPIERQSGAVPYTIVDKQIVFLLVTARRTGRWIFPKGSVAAGMSAWDSAAKEAMEEAGVKGVIGTVPVGTYWLRDKTGRIPVDLYPLKVEQQFESWKEKDQRLRHWALLPEAQRLIADRALSRIPQALKRQLTSRSRHI
jgi:8-oxo-dGTP pyrophosphatase MutT (NUDIX family)